MGKFYPAWKKSHQEVKKWTSSCPRATTKKQYLQTPWFHIGSNEFHNWPSFIKLTFILQYLPFHRHQRNDKLYARGISSKPEVRFILYIESQYDIEYMHVISCTFQTTKLPQTQHMQSFTPWRANAEGLSELSWHHWSPFRWDSKPCAPPRVDQCIYDIWAIIPGVVKRCLFEKIHETFWGYLLHHQCNQKDI